MSILPHVEEDVKNPCKKIDKRENDGYCFRVRYYRCRIAVELFHSLADGTGAMIFLKTLAGRYLQLLGLPVEAGEGMLDCVASPKEAEMEDSHLKYARFRHIESPPGGQGLPSQDDPGAGAHPAHHHRDHAGGAGA